jgi:hypothetical protein
MTAPEEELLILGGGAVQRIFLQTLELSNLIAFITEEEEERFLLSLVINNERLHKGPSIFRYPLKVRRTDLDDGPTILSKITQIIDWRMRLAC